MPVRVVQREGEQACSSGTLVEERAFLLRLADVPEDVVLVAVALNGREFQLQAGNASGFTVAEVLHGNSTRGYALKVPFHHPAVRRQVRRQQPPLQVELQQLSHDGTCASSPSRTEPCGTT